MSPFGVANQTVVRQLGNRPGYVAQIRPKPAELGISAQRTAFVVPDRISFGGLGNGDVLAGLIEAVGEAGYDPVVASRDAGTATIEGRPENSLRYFDQSQNKRYAIVMIDAGGAR